jgi:DNA-binding transcriptional MerR regulator
MATALMQVRAAARELGVHENTLRRWEEAGLVNAVRLPSGVRRFRPEDVARLRDQIYGSASASADGEPSR